MTVYLERDAVVSSCGRYRYLLRRVWDFKRPRALFVMLNPSTADARVDDATIRSCARLCRVWGYGSFEVVNLYGWRATKPRELSGVADPIGPGNDQIVEAAIRRCDSPICAWGAHPMAEPRADVMLRLIGRHRPAAFCLGKTKAGAPRHPLYIKSGTIPERYP
ncbi:MAG: DUF1643 domain-containing protein [Xanthobacteraceae bacterium]|nr:DUF1643 domain-containing protein [Xanthobacteraceae bacterium]